MKDASNLSSLLDDAVREISRIAKATAWNASNDIAQDSNLRAGVQAVRDACAERKTKLGSHDAGDVWQLSCVLWNSAIELSAKGLCNRTAAAEQIAWLRHSACSMLLDLPQVSLQEDQQLQLIKFCLKTGETWGILDRWEQSELLLASAARLVTATCGTALAEGRMQQGTRLLASKAEEYCALVYEVHLARYTAACKTNQQELAREELMLTRAAAEDLAPTNNSSSLLSYKLARHLHAQAMQDIETTVPGTTINMELVQDALKAAYDLVLRAKGLTQEDAGSGTAAAEASAGRMKKLLQLEARVLLCLAYLQLQIAEDPAACLKCTEALRQLETAEGSHPAVSLLAFKSFVALGMLEEAEKEATGIAVSESTNRETCLAVLKELLQVPARIAQLKPDPHVLTSFTQMALEAATKASAAATKSTDAADIQQQQQTAHDLQQLVLEQLHNAADIKASLTEDPVLREQLRDVLFQYGLARFTAKDFDTAVSFFTATYDVCEDQVKGRVARVLAMCHLGQQQLGQAKSLCGMSDMYEPGVVATSFIRFKVLLLEGDESGVLHELKHMITCKDYCNDMLWLAFKEANTANADKAAKAALEQLYNLLIKQTDKPEQPAATATAVDTGVLDCTTGATHTTTTSSSGAPNKTSSTPAMPECVVLRVWVKLLLNDLQKRMNAVAAARKADEAAAANAEGAAADATQQQQGGTAAVTVAAACQSLAQLSEVLGRVNMRARKLGLEVFTGEKESAAVQQLEWFNTCAWNAGLHAAELSDYQGSAVLMNLCAQLMCQLPSLGPKQIRQQRMAYTIAAQAGLEVHRQAPEHQGSLRLAHRMCQAATAAASKLTVGPAGSSMATAADGAAEAYTLMLQFRVALCTKNSEDMRLLVEKMVAHPCVGADVLHKLHQMCNEEPHKYPEISVIALQGSLHKLMSSSSPNYGQVAVILRTLVQRAASDPARLKLYREACGILTTLPPGAYPEPEVAWLVSTCWNRGMHHCKFDRQAEAAAYMQVAVDMLPACTRHAAQKSAMLEQLTKTKASCGRAAVTD